MKKTRNNRIVKQNKSDEKFAKKIISQFAVSVIVFIIVFINSKMPNAISKNINQLIKQYLVVSIDFNKTFYDARVHIEDFLNQVQTRPANGDLQDTTNDVGEF